MATVAQGAPVSAGPKLKNCDLVDSPTAVKLVEVAAVPASKHVSIAETVASAKSSSEGFIRHFIE